METLASEATVAASNVGTDAQSPKDPSMTIGGAGPEIGMNRTAAIRTAKSVAAAIAPYRTRFDGTERRICFLPAQTDPGPLTVPLIRPCSPIRPFTRPAGVTKPFTRPTPFTRPFVRPSPLTKPFTRPRPLTRPLTFPAPRIELFGRAPLTRPLLPRIHPSDSCPDGCAGARASRSAHEALAPAHPSGQESDGRRNGRGLGRRFRLGLFLDRSLDRRVHVHCLFEFFNEPIEHGGFREFELLRGEGLLQLADEEIVDEDVQVGRGPGFRGLHFTFRRGLRETRAARGTQGHVPRDCVTASWTDRSCIGEELVELRDLLIPRDVVEERVRRGPELLGRVGLAKFLRLDPELGNPDFSFVRRGGGGPVERLDRLVGPTH